MRNLFFVVLFFVTGCYSATPAPDLCEELCVNLEENGCRRSNCVDNCHAGQELLTELRCEQEHVTFSECLLGAGNLCEFAGSGQCTTESAALSSCANRGACEDACDMQELHGCGEDACVSDCEGLNGLAQESGCVADWNAWVMCERSSSACGQCGELLNELQGCVVSLER